MGGLKVIYGIYYHGDYLESPTSIYYHGDYLESPTSLEPSSW